MLCDAVGPAECCEGPFRGPGGRTFHSVFRGELLAVVLEVQYDLGPLPDTAGLRDLKHPGAGGAHTLDTLKRYVRNTLINITDTLHTNK